MNACSYTTSTPTPAPMDIGSTKGILGSFPAGLRGDRLQASSHDSARPIKACSSRPAIQSQSFETWQALGLKFQEEPAGLASRLATFVHSVTAYPVKSPQQQISPRTSKYPYWPSRPRFLAFWAILVSACPRGLRYVVPPVDQGFRLTVTNLGFSLTLVNSVTRPTYLVTLVP